MSGEVHMLRQDMPLVQLKMPDGLRIEIGFSLLLFAFVMVHLTGGIAGFLHDLAIFVLILFSFYMREVFRLWVVKAQGLEVYGVRFSGAGGSVEHSRGSIEQQELIAAMGPITSFGLWAISSLLLTVLPEASMAATWLYKFAFINFFIGIITILPAQPLDGGRFLYLYLGRTISVSFARRVMGAFGLALSVIWLPAMLLSFLIFGIVLLSLPSISEHWAMLKGEAAVEG